MRLAPIPLYYLPDPATALSRSRDISTTTGRTPGSGSPSTCDPISCTVRLIPDGQRQAVPIGHDLGLPRKARTLLVLFLGVGTPRAPSGPRNESAVQMNKATAEVKLPVSKYYWRGWMRGKGVAPLRMMDRWSRISTTGVIGDPTQATAAKGQRFFDEAAAVLAEIIAEFRALPIAPAVDHPLI